MITANIPLVGQSYESRTIPLSAQVTRNLYIEPVAEGLSPSALLSWPGSKLFATGNDANRGMYDKVWNDNVFTVEGGSLWKTNLFGQKSEVGSIPGSDRCIFAAAQNFLYVVTEGNVYRTNGSSIQSVTDVDLESPNSVAFLNSQLIYDGAGGRFAVSDPGDGTSIDSLSYATAESNADDTIRVYVFGENLIVFGTQSIEQWWNTGNGSPPVDRYQGSQKPVGLGAVHAVTSTDKAPYFLGHDRTIYRLEGFETVQVSTVALNNAIEGYRDVSDCFALSLKIQGQSMVIFNFPKADKTWAYSENLARWVELSSGVNGGRHAVNGNCFAFGKNLISDYRDGKLFEWDVNTFSDNGSPIVRERVTQPITSDLFGIAGKTVFWQRLELILNSGSGLAKGQGKDPQVMMSYSDDLGRTWSSEQWVSAGVMGAYEWVVEWDSLGAAEARVFKFRCTDPVEFNMFKLQADVEVGI